MSTQLRSCVPFVLACLFVFCLSVDSVSAGTRIQPNNLSYLGYFKVPNADGVCSSTPNARALGLTYDPSGNGGAGSFFLAGRQNDDCIAEINKPSVGGTASFLQQYTHVLNNKKDTVDDCYNGCFIGGNMLYGNNLYVSVFSYYDSEGNQPTTLFKRSRTLSNLSGFSGPSAVVSGQQGFTNAWMQEVPNSLKPLLGEAVIGGSDWSVISRTSLGPALYSFDPNNLGTATPLVQYPDGHRTLNEWAAPGSHPEANPTTKIGDMTFIEGSDTILFGGETGKGEYCYGTSCYDPMYPGTQGTHAYPYVNYLWAYDVDDLAAAKAGTVQPYDVFPYAHWELSDFGASDEWSITGMAFDSTASRLYVLASRWPDGTAAPSIHVYQVDGLTPDTTPPTSPTNLAATATSQSSITVSWTAATDDVGVTNYIVERCQGSSCTTFTQVGTPTASPFVDTGLTANTVYNYHVRAVDTSGNPSGWSNVVGATTQAPDTTPPTAPTSLSATATSSSAIDLTWTASTDNVAVTGYKVERCSGASCTTFTQVGTPTTNSYQDTGLSASTTYRYQVRAVDAANNNSSYSTIASASTPQAPPSPTFVAEYETPWNTTTSPKTTSNFSVQTGDILVAYAVNESSGSTIATPPTGTLTGTWTLKQTISATNYTYLRLWTMQVASNQTNVNVSFTNGGGNFGADVLHFRNASSVGITAQANSATGNPTLTLNGISDNSSIVMVNGDWSAKTGARTYNTTSAGTFTETSAYADGTSYGVEGGYYANAGTAGNKTIGITAPTGMTWALAAIEIKGNPTAQSQSCNTVTTTNFSQSAYNSYGAPFDAFQTSTNLLDAKCTTSDTHTVNLTTGVTGDTTRIVYTKGYYYDPVTAGWTQYSGTCNGALNGEWCQGSISATITNPNISTASAINPTYLVGMTCSVQNGSWRCGCRDTTCANFYWQVQGAGQ